MEQQKITPPPRPIPPPRPTNGGVLPTENLQNVASDGAQEKNIQYVQSQNQSDLQENSTKLDQQSTSKDHANVTQSSDKTKNKKKSKKVLLISLLICFVVLLVGGGVCTFFYFENLKNAPLDIQDAQIQICEMSEKVYLLAEKTSCKQYVFLIEEQNNTNTIYSKYNLLDITDFLQVGKQYKVSYYVQNASPKSKSKTCVQKTFLFSKKLQTPNLWTENQTLYWQNSDGATSYTLYYFDSQGSLQSITLDAKNGLNSFVPQFDLGIYEFWLVANSQNTGVLQSLPSNHVMFKVLQTESNIDSISVDRDNCLISVNLTDNTNAPTFMIFVGDQIFTSTQSEISDNYVINLKTSLKTISFGQKVGVKILARAQYFVDGQICFE